MYKMLCTALLKVATSRNEAKQIHSLVAQNKLISMYVKCGSLMEGRKVFDEMGERDGFSWNAMISGYRREGYSHEALKLFYQMQGKGRGRNPTPDQFVFASILPACAKIGALEQGINIHHNIIESGFSSDVVVASALVDMYAKCGCIHKARELFDKMSKRDMIAWNSMIAGYVQNDFLDEALRLFKKMPRPDVASWNALITGYARKGFLHDALRLFNEMPKRDVVSWNAMITGYLQNGALDDALRIFNEMPQRNLVSWNAMIAGYVQNGVLDEATRLFKAMPRHDVISWNVMIAGYAQNGALEEALRLFNEMPQRNVVSWTAMIAGYAQNGLVEKALETFKQMYVEGVQPNSTTFSGILPSCAKVGALEQGMDIHRKIIEGGFSSDIVVVSALVDMYAKCGSIHKARDLFDNMPERNVISWTAMVAGYAQNGLVEKALETFNQMQLAGVSPNSTTFVCVLFACNHAGLVDEGCRLFCDITDYYCIMLNMDHYVCMVDLLGRASYLEEALTFIVKMSIKPAVPVWMCFLCACKRHKYIKVGVFTATLLFELDPENATPYVLLSNIYAEVGRWDDVQKIRSLMKDRGIKKIPGCSWIEVHKMVYAFLCRRHITPTNRGDICHVEGVILGNGGSRELSGSRHVLNDVEEENEIFSCHLSEKLATASGLLTYHASNIHKGRQELLCTKILEW
ncbi:pentatricopeptide repeat-containing protein At4g02750 [Cryptomeria japonica]|uniref:pentatricopeptide repeat-containing protein At4g02750 n=1 Tax=Cryptomeria japonica TaxID=3369 RepID=UPI0027DA5255|nr:pentatricopeptide repeat-containing protein At4g02750 [Cryptomeria japonica]XP_059063298.1 pentatricopeptide repeat-containing protein At4g02750 [Cryptomeria japonica]